MKNVRGQVLDSLPSRRLQRGGPTACQMSRAVNEPTGAVLQALFGLEREGLASRRIIRRHGRLDAVWSRAL